MNQDLSGNLSPNATGEDALLHHKFWDARVYHAAMQRGPIKTESHRALITSFEQLNPSKPVQINFLVMSAKKLIFLLMDWISVICNRKRVY